MPIPRTVFIDTSVFRAAQFNFRGRQFKALLATVPAGRKLKLLVPEPTAGEITRHLSTSATEAIHALKKIRREHSVLCNVLELPENPAAVEDLERVLRNKLRADWTAFKAKFDAKEIDYAGVNLREIMGWYFRQHAPFGPGDKQKEFPDALAFVMVRDYAARTEERVAVISLDDKFRDACEGVPGLFPFSQISELTNLLLKQEESFTAAEQIVAELRSNIIEKIKDDFPDRAFDHALDPNGHGFVENVTVIDVETPKDALIIVGLGHRKIDVQFSVKVRYEADVKYDDPDSWISGDPGDDVFYLHTCEGRVIDEAEISGIARITVAENSQLSAVAWLEIDEDTIEVTSEAPQMDDRDVTDEAPDEPGAGG